MDQHRYLVIAIGTALLLAACGTTVPLTPAEQAAAGGAGADTGMGLGAMDPQAASGGVLPGGSGVQAQAGGAPSATGGGGLAVAQGRRRGSGRGAQGAVGAAGSGRAPVSNAGSGPGITSQNLYLGAAYSSNGNEANERIGSGYEGGGDERQYYNAVIDDINDNGGIAGRRMVPVYYAVDAASTETSTYDQAMCTHWTQDNKVFAMVAGGDVLLQCARRAGAVAVATTFSTATSTTFRKFPNYFEPSTVRLDRLGGVTTSGLHAQGYFTKGAKIGLVTWDLPSYREAIERSYLPALASLGISAPEVAYVKSPESVNGVGESSAAVSSAVLRFKSEGVSHVMILDGGAGACAGTCLTLLFMNTAESQAYRPRYGLNDTNSPRSGLFPPEQMRDARIVTWVDHSPELDEGYRTNRSRERCLRIMADHGVDTSSLATRVVALAACDLLWFVDTASEAAGPALNATTFAAAVDRLGTAHVSPLVYGTRFDPSHHDGVYLARHAHWDSGCECVKLDGKPYRIQ